jgi:hypothetical protein
MDETRRELRRLQQRAQKQTRRRDDTTGLSQWVLQTALLISLLTNYDFSAGAAWLSQKKRYGAPMPEGEDEASMTRRLEGFFMTCDVTSLATWTEPSLCPLPPTVQRAAHDFVHGRRLSQWVRKRNLEGAVVMTRTLVERYNSQSPPACIPIETFGAFMWASRWRRKFGARHMSLRTEDPVPLDERRNKVVQTRNAPPLATKMEFPVPENGHQNEASLRRFLGPPLLAQKRDQNRVQFLGTFLSLDSDTFVVQFCWRRCWFEGEDCVAMVPVLVSASGG